MPASMYQLVFNDAKMQKLAPGKLQVGTYTTDTVKIVGSCTFYLVHPDTKKLIEVTFYVTRKKREHVIVLQHHFTTWLDKTKAETGLPPTRNKSYHQLCRSPQENKSSITYNKTKVSAQTTKQEVAAQTPAANRQVSKLITSKEMILHEYPDVFEGISKLPGSDYHIQVDPSIPSKQTPCKPIPVNLKDKFQQEIKKMGYLLQCMKQPQWINSFVLVESKDILGNLKLHTCLDSTNLNKVITREYYHFRTPGNIAHLLADTCIMRVCDFKKGYWHQKLDQASSYLIMFNTEIGRFRYTGMPFDITVARICFKDSLISALARKIN